MVEKDELNLKKYPKEFQLFLKKEMELVKKFVKSSDKVLDIGCGKGRAIPEISPIVSKYVGIDIDKDYITEAKKISDNFKNSEVIELDVENLSDQFTKNEFDKSFSLFNTISCLKDYRKALKEIHKVTKNKFYFSVCAKGSNKIREKYYDMIGVNAKFDSNETFYSSAWGEVKAFSENEIRKICKEIGFKIDDIILLEGYSYAIIVSK